MGICIHDVTGDVKKKERKTCTVHVKKTHLYNCEEAWEKGPIALNYNFLEKCGLKLYTSVYYQKHGKFFLL